ncbi:ferritin-like domain-containing protein [Mesorhizobium sp. RP14(2022)]|uniref:Ferritin-like domain-containing protein n=1 Tax=Mesorhizobium liriopis TaxID=2953882 RepID=A0ABT1CAP2_9HYPH|nr:ferritin-like domain-containing protein [Mesorhizobium liriopis]MCO6051900.1 ferritin-like domain-containing protein [Mesorhizobium liriopis]
MVTTVGTESTFEKLVQNLLILEHDAIAAYESTIEKLDNPTSKAKIAEFKADHDSHVVELTRLAGALGVEAPQEGDMKEYLTTGKIALASIVGDRTILKAMATNEIETKMAYDQASKNSAASPEAQAFFRKALADETRHKDWMDAAAADEAVA